MGNSIQEFEKLKSEVEELKLKKLSDEREKERLEGELEDLKKTIKDTYGVEIEDFENAIRNLQEEFEKEFELLKNKIEDCKQILGV